MKVWEFIISNLTKNINVVLLYVIESSGSSPGRKGFVMAVNESGEFTGTIGGGIMEVKLITLAKEKLNKNDHLIIIKEQFHNKIHPKNSSGLICSGKQSIAIIPLDPSDKDLINRILSSKQKLFLKIDPISGLSIIKNAESESILLRSETEFEIVTAIKKNKCIHIFGAGHVGIALKDQMTLLGYEVNLYDDRADLQLQKTDQLKIIDYKRIINNIIFDPSDLIVIVSFSYRTDLILIKQLYQLDLAYIGMMGSDQKIKNLKKELSKNGISNDDIKHVFTPIGVNIYSKTAAEIAVSIAAQIILETNKNLPTGRTY